MELKEDLHILIERAEELYDSINNTIHHDLISFCRHCSGQILLCGIPEMSPEEKEWLTSIGDSLKEVQGMLVFLQRLELCHQGNICSVLAGLDQSRMLLIEIINQYPNHDRKLDVLEELQLCFGNLGTSQNWNFKGRQKKKKDQRVKNGVFHFLFSCIGSLFNPRNLNHAIHMAMKVIVISAGVSSTVYIHRNMTEYKKTMENDVVSTMVQRETTLLPTDSNSPLAVLRGRG